MKYERLTKRLPNGAVEYESNGYVKILYPENVNCYDEGERMILRLAELEDKIESGQAVIFTEEEAKYYKEYKRLIKSTGSARNAFMYTMGATDEERKKQEALGFTIGAPIYVIIPGDEHIYEKVCRSVTIDKDGITINGVWSTNECFTTKKAAEAKLKELRGEE